MHTPPRGRRCTPLRGQDAGCCIHAAQVQQHGAHTCVLTHPHVHLCVAGVDAVVCADAPAGDYKLTFSSVLVSGAGPGRGQPIVNAAGAFSTYWHPRMPLSAAGIRAVLCGASCTRAHVHPVPVATLCRHPAPQAPAPLPPVPTPRLPCSGGCEGTGTRVILQLLQQSLAAAQCSVSATHPTTT